MDAEVGEADQAAPPCGSSAAPGLGCGGVVLFFLPGLDPRFGLASQRESEFAVRCTTKGVLADSDSDSRASRGELDPESGSESADSPELGLGLAGGATYSGAS